MDLKNKINNYLQIKNFKPGYLWKPQYYLNGFLVNLLDYNGAMMDDFQRIMSNYCEIGYFISETGINQLPTFKLTMKGYQELVNNK